GFNRGQASGDRLPRRFHLGAVESVLGNIVHHVIQHSGSGLSLTMATLTDRRRRLMEKSPHALFTPGSGRGIGGDFHRASDALIAFSCPRPAAGTSRTGAGASRTSFSATLPR